MVVVVIWGEEEFSCTLAGGIQFSETVPGRLGQEFQAGISGPGKTRGMGP